MMMMKSVFRNGSISSSSALFLTLLNRSPKPINAAPLAFSIRSFSSTSAGTSLPSSSDFSSTMVPVETSATRDSSLSLLSSSVKKQFEDYKMEEEKFDKVAAEIRSVTEEISSVNKLLDIDIHVLRDPSRPLLEILEDCKVQVDALRQLYTQIAEIVKAAPLGDFHRYESIWRGYTEYAVSYLVFLHWLETGNLLLHKEAEKKLGLDSLESGLCFKDYLSGFGRMSKQMPHYVMKEVAASNYDCPKQAVKFLKEMVAAFRILNDPDRNYWFRNLKDNLKKVEEIIYDVQIRGLTGPSKIPNDVRDEAVQSIGRQAMYTRNAEDMSHYLSSDDEE